MIAQRSLWRAAGAAVLACAMFAVIALSWRAVSPYPDRLVGFLPTETYAYVHVNLTASTRRMLRQAEPEIRAAGGAALAVALQRVLEAPDVRELAFAWYRPQEGAPTAALLVGQRPSSRPDVRTDATVQVGGRPLRIFVVRAAQSPGSPLDRALAPERSLPIQAAMHPKSIAQFPGLPFQAAAGDLPERIVASGGVTRGAILLGSHVSRTVLLPFSGTEEIRGVADGVVEARGVPLRAWLSDIATPAVDALRVKLLPEIPEFADVAVRLRDGAASLHVEEIPAFSTETLRTIAAIVWPTTQSGVLDGLTVPIAVANPRMIAFRPVGDARWEVIRGRKGAESRVAVVAVGDGAAVATDAELLEGATGAWDVPTRCTDAPGMLWVGTRAGDIRLMGSFGSIDFSACASISE